jgi:bifunctional DNA-binding transcriptional regulator/antitoxin component of YhaV-PrlF toxin-antitoxin module
MTYNADISATGTVELPAELLKEAGLKAGDRLVIERDADNRLILKTRAQVLREVQQYMRRFVPEGRSLVDELIAERRAEAAREDAEFEEWQRARDKG